MYKSNSQVIRRIPYPFRLKDCCLEEQLQNPQQREFCVHDVKLKHTKGQSEAPTQQPKTFPQVNESKEVKYHPHSQQISNEDLRNKNDLEYEKLYKRNLKYLYHSNLDYFAQKYKLCCKPIPFRGKNPKLFPINPGKTVYMHDYVPKKCQKTKELNNNHLRYSGTPQNYPQNSTYRNDYVGHPLQIKKKKQKIPFHKFLPSPFYNRTQYNNDYKNPGPVFTDTFKPSNLQSLVTGIPLNTKTIYKHDYIPFQQPKPQILKAPQSLHNPLNSLVGYPEQTTYQYNYKPWESQKTELMKPKSQFLPKQTIKTLYDTIYGNEYKDKKDYPSALNNKCFWAKMTKQQKLKWLKEVGNFDLDQ